MPKKIPTQIVIGATDRVSKVLNRVGSRFSKLSRQVRRASIAFKLFQRRTARVRAQLMKTGAAMRRTGASMTRSMSMPIGLVGAGILSMGVKFQKSMNKVGALTKTIVKGVVSKEFEALKNRALELGATTEFSASQVADAMGIMGQQGFNPKQIDDMIESTLSLATATGVDMAQAIDIAGKALKGFGLQSEDMPRIADAFAEATRSSNINMETLGETMKVIAPIAKAYGTSMEETVAITGLLGDVGIQGTMAGTAMKSMFLKIADPSAKANQMLSALGVSVADSAGNMNSMGTILSDLGVKLKNVNKQDQLKVLNELFGLRGIAGGAALMQKAVESGLDPIAKFTKQIEASKGAAKDMQDTMNMGAVGAMNRFKSALEGVAISFAESGLLEAFADLLDSMSGFFKWIQALSPATKKFIMIFAGILAIAGPIIWIIGAMSTGIGALITAFGFLGSVFTFILPAIQLVFGIIGGVVGAIGALATGIILLIGLLVRAAFVWDELVAAFKAGSGFFDTVGKMFGAIMGTDESKQRVLGANSGAQTQVAAAAGQNSVLTNNAKVDVTIGGLPKGSKAKMDGGNFGSLNLGFQGAMN